MNKGFSALEIIVTLSILALLITISVGYFSAFQGAVTIDGVIESLVALIREARSRTLAPEDGSQFGVHLEQTRAVLFKGTEFVEDGADNKVYTLPDGAEIFNISFTGGDLLFNLLTGEPSEAGSFSVRLKNDTSNTKTIFINSAGLTYVQ